METLGGDSSMVSAGITTPATSRTSPGSSSTSAMRRERIMWFLGGFSRWYGAVLDRRHNGGVGGGGVCDGPTQPVAQSVVQPVVVTVMSDCGTSPAVLTNDT
ncbi:hypothetical protein GCM10010417_11200 [Streptomyces carpaticus]